MSLINDVLRDLDHKEEPKLSTGPLSGSVGLKSAPKKSRIVVILFGVLFVLALLIALIILFKSRPKHPQQVVIHSVVAATQAAPIKAPRQSMLHQAILQRHQAVQTAAVTKSVVQPNKPNVGQVIAQDTVKASMPSKVGALEQASAQTVESSKPKSSLHQRWEAWRHRKKKAKQSLASTAQSIKIQPVGQRDAQVRTVSAGIQMQPSHVSNKVKTLVDTKSIQMRQAGAVTDLLQRATNLTQRGQFEQAVKLLSSAPQMASYNVDLYRLLALLYLQRNQIQMATYTVQTGLAHNVNNVDLLLVKSRVQLAQDNFNGAIATLSQQNPTFENHIDYYALMARLYLQLKQPKIAQVLYQKLIHAQPNHAAWWLGLGMAYENQQKEANASDSFRQALQIGGLSPQVQAYLQSHMG